MRPLLAALACACLLAPAGAAAPAPDASVWAKREIGLVVSHGLMAVDVASFRPEDALTRAELEELVAGLTGVTPLTPARPDAFVTMTGLNQRLVRALGLQDVAASFAAGARSAGLAPPPRFGWEVAARLLALRKNHPAPQDALERLPNENATRAEAAFSAARILSFTGREAEAVREAALSFELPALDEWQRRILRTAVSLVGHPYVWGGTNAKLERGFDCSGFVWRVYKLARYPDGGRLAATLRGRTTFAMSAEVPPAERIAVAGLGPGDIAFFGARGPKSKPAQVDHMGIYLGSGWMVHSSREGVALAPLTGWWAERFAWARRPLAEAGLAPAAVARIP